MCDQYDLHNTGFDTLMSDHETRLWKLGGRVQGVGFRPFVYRLAREYGLSGWVVNHSGQVEILAQGEYAALDGFASALIRQAPAIARPTIHQCRTLKREPLAQFSILQDGRQTQTDIHVTPDISLCAHCLQEMQAPDNRRYRYPFNNCSQCGPRYTIINSLPYERHHTAMDDFELCPRCRAEYDSAADRRFHAQTISCPDCGPTLHFGLAGDSTNLTGEAALAAAVAALRDGAIVAIKGIGGYHLACDALDNKTVQRLRRRKRRPEKPLAVMLPMTMLAGRLPALVDAKSGQINCLTEPLRPIVLVDTREGSPLSTALAPDLNEVGIMLPYTALHHLLLESMNSPLVMTSANHSGEPVYTDNHEARRKLAQVADAFLDHDRRILHPADDPVYRTIAGRSRPVRLGRGNAPLEMELPTTLDQPLLAVGGHMKNTIALAWRNRVVISAHVGDLTQVRTLDLFQQQIEDLQTLYQVEAATVVCDTHPDYASSRWARNSGKQVIKVLHHHAHAAALAGEHPDVRRWLVFTWDGVGMGEHGALWGGEGLLGQPGDWCRRTSFRPFHIPAADQAARQPWRSAASLVWECGLEWPDCPHDDTLLRAAWQRRLNSPASSSVGRLFDAAAALLGLVHTCSYEAQAAMLLEATVNTEEAAGNEQALTPLPVKLNDQGLYQSDWRPLLACMLNPALTIGERAEVFHRSLARTLLDQALAVRKQDGRFSIGLGGGVFQNRRLTEYSVALLEQHDFDVRLGTRVPINDAGISFGQIIQAAAGLQAAADV